MYFLHFFNSKLSTVIHVRKTNVTSLSRFNMKLKLFFGDDLFLEMVVRIS